MINQNFYKKKKTYNIKEIASIINCHNSSEILEDKSQLLVSGINTLKNADIGDLSFFSNNKYLEEFKNTKASVCIVPLDISTSPKNDVILLKVKNPYLAYAMLSNELYQKAKSYKSTIKRSAHIASTAKIGNNCYIGHNVVIEENCIIGDNTIIDVGSFIDFGVTIGKRGKIYSNVSISYSIIGNDVTILPGARIGQDGFSFAVNEDVYHSIFHTGLVRIGNNVEIGSNTTIDRGSIEDTIIEDLCRIDNLVQIAHNVKLGRGSIIAAQVGVAGSSTIGQYCNFGGQAGVVGHLVIGDKVKVAAQSGVMRNVEPQSFIGGSPAIPIKDLHRQTILIKKMIKEGKVNEH